VNHDRDGMAHAVWYAPRQWYVLWVTRTGETQITDMVLVCDLSLGLAHPRWWQFRLPAVVSRIEKFADGEQRLLVSNYHGQVWVFDSGETDGVQGRSVLGRVSAFDATAGTVTCDNAWFDDDEGSTVCNGAVVTVLSGLAADQRRLLAEADGQVLTVDKSYGGFFSGLAVGDWIMLGGYGSSWRSPLLSAGTATAKRWQVAEIQTTATGGNPIMEQVVRNAGRDQATTARALAAGNRNTHTVKMQGRGEHVQLAFERVDPCAPWQVNGITVLADAMGGVR
jgi:hypothetical protein